VWISFFSLPETAGFFVDGFRERRAPLAIEPAQKTRSERVLTSLPVIRPGAIVMMRRRTTVMVVVMRRHMATTRYQTAMHPHAVTYGTCFGRGRHEGACRNGQQHQRHQFAHEISCSKGRHFKMVDRFVQRSMRHRRFVKGVRASVRLA
jgi:hypothetical protein